MSAPETQEADELGRLRAACDALLRENAALRAANRALRRDLVLVRCDLREEQDRKSGAWAARARAEAPQPVQEALFPPPVDEPIERVVARSERAGLATHPGEGPTGGEGAA